MRADLANTVTLRLPSRYEDLDPIFRGRLRPIPGLIEIVERAYSNMVISGGIRFLPIYGRSGSGKTSAAIEFGTHLPDCTVRVLPRDAVDQPDGIDRFMQEAWGQRKRPKLVIGVVDQYEESVAERGAIPSQFVERLSLTDRGDFRQFPTLFLWLTTRETFRDDLVAATSRNQRILVADRFELAGPPKDEWPSIIEETFEFHNADQPLADYGILVADLEAVADETNTIGAAIERVGELLTPGAALQDLSQYQVLMLWPVTDGLRIDRLSAFTHARDGYRLNWNSWYRELNSDDQKQLPLKAFNRARLYFDVRLIPIAAADLYPLCRNLEKEDVPLHDSYLRRFRLSHFFSILNGTWSADNFTRMRERESARADEARGWYESITNQPSQVGRRLARILRTSGLQAAHERDVRSSHGVVRADVLVEARPMRPTNGIVELKLFSAENTMPSAIRDQIRITLRRHAQFAGFLERQ